MRASIFRLFVVSLCFSLSQFGAVDAQISNVSLSPPSLDVGEYNLTWQDANPRALVGQIAIVEEDGGQGSGSDFGNTTPTTLTLIQSK
jgi:hypothetical protein